MTRELDYTELKKTIEAETLGFATTAELDPETGIIGQKRAEEALKFGLGVKTKGYNIFV
jgi:hypothetical protein